MSRCLGYKELVIDKYDSRLAGFRDQWSLSGGGDSEKEVCSEKKQQTQNPETQSMMGYQSSFSFL